MDWRWLKALLWVESGGPANPSWTKRPMQIGNPGDPAYRVLKAGQEGANLVLAPSLQADLKRQPIDSPTLNIRAGVGYVFVRMAMTEMASVPDATDACVHEYEVLPGDTFDRISKKVGTTLAVLQELNPEKTLLRPKDKVKFRKAKVERVIVGWRVINATSLAQRYNVGDPSYAAKLTFVMGLF